MQHSSPTSQYSSGTESRAVRALLANVIDYAGLFPPAKLTMSETVANYAKYLERPDSWLLERLIIPVAQLDEFERDAADFLPRGDDDLPWPISVLVSPAGDDERFTGELKRILTFNEKHAALTHGLAEIDVIEMKAQISAEINSVLDLLPEELFVFFEIPINADPRGLIAACVGSEAGVKMRTGGITADLYPTPDEVARFIAACASADVPFKATAGLHHPLYHPHESLGVHELGFLNVFIAGVLAYQREFSANDLVAILTESNSEAFNFTSETLRWRDETLDATEIEDARLAFVLSFGSCSFEEPADDLRAMGLLR